MDTVGPLLVERGLGLNVREGANDCAIFNLWSRMWCTFLGAVDDVGDRMPSTYSSFFRGRKGGWACGRMLVWKRMGEMSPVVRSLLSHLGAPNTRDCRGMHPLVAGLVAAMDDVRATKGWVRVMEADEQPVPEETQTAEETHSWGSFADTRSGCQKELSIFLPTCFQLDSPAA
ncbi:hypothetical protein CYMTET_15842 [Cymbomonas tetramitiformis]|uniref:Uncharacterized protein n=1 Tax=Cymbomonas tetramitiformis TaxID=36881 RepID=A0AAE0L8R8_9CHLO|nr:hypothetical protein CYMTET_15842 [Cymbomonas tetramitiformis]